MSTLERTEDQVFADFCAAEGEDRVELGEELHRRLHAHAHAVVWLTLQERRPDIVEEAIFEVMRKPEAFRGGSKFTTWFEAIVRNICRRKLRYTIKHRNDVGLDELELVSGEATEAPSNAKLDLAAIRESLAPEEKTLLDMKYQEFPEEAIARELGISKKGIRTRWHRLRRRILEDLE